MPQGVADLAHEKLITLTDDAARACPLLPQAMDLRRTCLPNFFNVQLPVPHSSGNSQEQSMHVMVLAGG